jgi:hypothetical protein
MHKMRELGRQDKDGMHERRSQAGGACIEWWSKAGRACIEIFLILFAVLYFLLGRQR